jgi:hypothetical protein
VAFEALELNIARLEEDMALLQTRQSVVSDEVKHEVEEALNATADFMEQQKPRLTRRLSMCSATAIFLIWQASIGRFRGDEPEGLQQLVLEDEGQAQIALSKIRSSCELIMLDAQRKSAGSWRYASISWSPRWRVR